MLVDPGRREKVSNESIKSQKNGSRGDGEIAGINPDLCVKCRLEFGCYGPKVEVLAVFSRRGNKTEPRAAQARNKLESHNKRQ